MRADPVDVATLPPFSNQRGSPGRSAELRCAPTRWLRAQPFDALDARQSEFCGEDTTAGVDMRKLRFRPRRPDQGEGFPRVLYR